MLSFNLLLEAAGIRLPGVSLLRHQDTRMTGGWSTYRLWRLKPAEFARYETIQARDVFTVGGHVASFVVDPVGDVVFVGLSAVRSKGLNESREVFDYLDDIHPPGSVFVYELERDERFEPYAGRLVIDWGQGARSWYQRAARQDKPILELRRDVRDVEWPGYMDVRISELDVAGLAPNWTAKLSAANGVYLLVCPRTGDQYVGAAFGAGGFLARWKQYAANGHGGNKLLKRRRKEIDDPLEISILEVFGSTMTVGEAINAETRWKKALGTRAHGLNAN